MSDTRQRRLAAQDTWGCSSSALLNISREEQRRRMLRRIDLPDHDWKFPPADVRERERWSDYQRAFA